MTNNLEKNSIDGHATYYEQNKKIVERNVDNASFLVNPETEEIFYLNSLSSAIWQLLEQPIRIDEVVDIVIKAFPDIPAEQIHKDTSNLFLEFTNKGIVRRCD